MVSSIQQRIQGGIELIGGEIDYLVREENAQRDDSPFIRFASETISGSSAQAHEAFVHDAAMARGFAMQASRALAEKNDSKAQALLGESRRWLATARSAFLKFHGRETSAASRSETALRINRNSGLSFSLSGGVALLAGAHPYTALGLGISAALHIAILSVASALHPSNEEQLQPPATPESTPPDGTKPPKNKPPVMCAETNGESADVGEGACTPRPYKPNPLEAWVDEAVAEPVTAVQNSPAVLKPGELIAKARLALEEWSKNPDTRHHYGHFFMDADAIGKNQSTFTAMSKALHTFWDKRLEEYRQELSPIEEPSAKLEALMDLLYRDYLGLHVIGLAGFDDLLSGKGGNCEARMKLILSAVSDLELALPPNTKLAIQPFADHIQLVLYNTKTGDIFDFMTRQSSRETPVDLYDPHIVFDAFLKGQGVPSGMDAEKFVVAKANSSRMPGQPHPPSVTNTRFSFPSTDVYFGTAQSAQFAHTNSPYRASSGNAVNSFTDVDEYNDLLQEGVGFTFEDIEDPGRQQQLAECMERERLDFHMYGPRRYYFRKKTDADYFNALPSPEEKKKFLTRLSLQGIARHSADLRIGLDLLADPRLLERHSLSQIEHFLEASSNLFNAEATCWEALSYQDGDSLRFSKESLGLASLTLEAQSPTLQLSTAAEKSFRERFNKNPLAFVRFADRLSHKKRLLLLQMIGRFCIRTYENRNETQITFEAVIGNKNLLGVGDTPGSAPEFIEVVLAEGRGKPLAMERETKKPVNLADKKTNTKKGKKTEEDYFDDSNAPYRISFETFFDIVSEFNIGNRWSPRISRAFLKYNRNREYDYAVQRNYSFWADSYPARLRTVKYDPYAGRRSLPSAPAILLPPDIAHILDVINRRKQSSKKTSSLTKK